MRTEELLRALTADGARPVVPIRRTLAAALLTGTLLSVLVFGLLLHPRPDIAQAIYTGPFVFKLIVCALLAGTAAALLSDTARPLPRFRRYWSGLLASAPLLLGIAIIVELTRMPAHTWTARLIGHNAAHCLLLIPMLSLAPAGCVLVGLRNGAPIQPALAGAIAGLVAGGVAAALYALSCPDDSPLFVATWYSIAIAAVTAASSYAGRHVLRW